MIKWPLFVILILIGTIIGYSLCYFNIVPIDLDEKINVLDFVTLLITVFLAFYIPHAIERSIASKRYEREILIGKIEKIQDTFNGINKVFYDCISHNMVSEDNALLIVQSFSEISVNLKTLMSLAKRSCSNQTCEKLDKIKILRGEYKRIITGGGFRPGFIYPISTRINANRAISIIDTELSNLIFDINMP